MTAKELAELLNGRGYGNEVSPELVQAAKSSGLVILYGASDDLAELEGAIRDEAGCYEGGVLLLTPTGFLEGECPHDDDCPHYKAHTAIVKQVKALWCKAEHEGKTCAWAYETDIPHETFVIVDNDDFTGIKGPYCRGIVFEASALSA